MWSNTKLLVLASLLIIISGFGLLWFGWNQTLPVQPGPSLFPIPPATDIPEATSSAKVEIAGEKALVTKVIDGDTIVVNDELTVRLIGIDTPETVDLRRPVGCFGKEASNETKSLILNKEVVLQKDISETDKYHRLLRYVYLPLENVPPGSEAGRILFVNDYLIRSGFAKVLTYPPDVKYNEQFRQAEREARENKRGLWKKC